MDSAIYKPYFSYHLSPQELRGEGVSPGIIIKFLLDSNCVNSNYSDSVTARFYKGLLYWTCAILFQDPSSSNMPEE